MLYFGKLDRYDSSNSDIVTEKSDLFKNKDDAKNWLIKKAKEVKSDFLSGRVYSWLEDDELEKFRTSMLNILDLRRQLVAASGKYKE